MISTHVTPSLTLINDSESNVKVGQWANDPAYISVNGKEIEMDLDTLKALSGAISVFFEKKNNAKTWVDMD